MARGQWSAGGTSRGSHAPAAAPVDQYVVLLPVGGHLPESGRLDNLLDELLEGALHALPRLGRRLDEHHLVLPRQLDPLVLGHHAVLQVALQSKGNNDEKCCIS